LDTDELYKEENDESNAEEGQEKFSYGDVLNIINMLPDDSRDLLLMVYPFRDIKNLLNYEETYNRYMKDVQSLIERYFVLKSIVNNLHALSMAYGTKDYKMKKVIKECQSINKKDRAALGVTLMAGAALENVKDVICGK